ETARPTEPGAHAGMTETIVLRALIGISEHSISFGGFFEFFFGVAVTGIAIGMELHGELAVAALDLLLAGAARDAQHFVIIAFGVGGQKAVLSSRLSVLGCQKQFSVL